MFKKSQKFHRRFEMTTTTVWNCRNDRHRYHRVGCCDVVNAIKWKKKALVKTVVHSIRQLRDIRTECINLQIAIFYKFYKKKIVNFSVAQTRNAIFWLRTERRDVSANGKKKYWCFACSDQESVFVALAVFFISSILIKPFSGSI